MTTAHYCNDCGNHYGFCACEECNDCGALAEDRCFECESHFCGECLHAKPGVTEEGPAGYCAPRVCGECLAKLATYVPCATSAPTRPCASLTFAPELLHECAACHQDFCAACIVKTPVPGTTFQAQYHCPQCYAARVQPTAA